jgi:hypothetical protein
MANFNLRKEENVFQLSSLFKLKEETREKSRGEATSNASSNESRSNGSGEAKKNTKENKSGDGKSVKKAALLKPTHESLMSDFRLFLQPLSTNRDKQIESHHHQQQQQQHQQQKFEDFKSYYIKKMTDFGFSGFNKCDTKRMESFISQSEPNLAAFSSTMSTSEFKQNEFNYMDSTVVNEMYESLRQEAFVKSKKNEFEKRKTSLDSNDSIFTTLGNELKNSRNKFDDNSEKTFMNHNRDLTIDYFKTRKKSKPHQKYFSPSLIICKSIKKLNFSHLSYTAFIATFQRMRVRARNILNTNTMLFVLELNNSIKYFVPVFCRS